MFSSLAEKMSFVEIYDCMLLSTAEKYYIYRVFERFGHIVYFNRNVDLSMLIVMVCERNCESVRIIDVNSPESLVKVYCP